KALWRFLLIFRIELDERKMILTRKISGLAISFLLLSAHQAWTQGSIQKQLLDSAWQLYESGDFIQAKRLNNLGIHESRMRKDLGTEAQCMINNGTIAFVEGNFDSAYMWYDS